MEEVNGSVSNTTSTTPLETLSNGIYDPTSFLDVSLAYYKALPGLFAAGDYFTVSISLILLYIAVYIFNKISGAILFLIKKGIFLGVTCLASFLIFSRFQQTVAAEGYTFNSILLGLVGIVVTAAGLCISIYSLYRSYEKWLDKKAAEQAVEHQMAIDAAPQPGVVAIEDRPPKQRRHHLQAQHTVATPAQHDGVDKHLDMNHMKDLKQFFSFDSLKNDKSLLSVMTFLVVAQFGVFSSATVSAPNIRIGLILFSIFILATFIFIRQSYNNYWRGLYHVLVTLIIGYSLSILLGHYWGGLPFSTLLSFDYFQTEALVALISGMALSLFAGSKN